MKKIFSMLILAALLALPAAVWANNVQGGYNAGQTNVQPHQGGYVGPVAVITVAEALKLRDDAHVVLEGQIIRYIGGEKYEFQDATGSVTIEIDDDYNWQGQNVGPEDVVVIYGEVDRDFSKFVIDVDRVVKK